MPEPTAHLTADTIEQLVEGTLPGSQSAAARKHVGACERCATELEAFQNLFAMLGELPRFAPSPVFTDAVMARVQIARSESRALALLKRLIPSTRRGWALISVAITAPAMPIIALVLWLITQPLLSPVTVAQWALIRTQSASQAGLAWLMEQTSTFGLWAWVETSYATIQTVPGGALSAAVAFLGIAIPLSGWALVRLTRTPAGSVNYAN